MKIGVVGCGIVGGNLADMLELKGHTVERFDPPKNLLDSLNCCKVIFVCVPTNDPSHEILIDSIDYVNKVNETCLIVIRSTVVPGTTDLLIKKYSREIIFMPEFLRERTAYQDTCRPDKVIIGSNNGSNAITIADLMKDIYSKPLILFASTIEAELIKVSINSLYTTKVVFCNELYDICQKVGVDYSKILRAFEHDKWINPMHLDPLFDGYRGAGGKCLPKDTNFLRIFAEMTGADSSLLKTVISKNNNLLKGEKNGKL
jgi:UDPglucose 6-dehydrogenase